MEEREFEIEIEGRKMKLVGNARDIEQICLDMSVITSEAAESYKRDGLDALSCGAWKARDVFYDIYKKLEEERENAEKTNPVTIHYGAEGNPDGVRVKTLDEDFIIALHDAEEGIEMTWNKAMEKYGNVLPTKKQASIICAYLDEIKAAMKEAGGDDLCGCYWTVAEGNASIAWFYLGCYGTLLNCGKFSAFSVRPVLT